MAPREAHLFRAFAETINSHNMKTIILFFSNQPNWTYGLSLFLVTLMTLDFFGVFPDKKSETPYDIQMKKVATIELENGSQVILKGYCLLEGNKDFTINDGVYMELDENCLPSSVRHFYDAHESDGQMYAETTLFGSYKANLVSGKVIALNY